LEGRLRIKIPAVKGAARKAREVEGHLALCPGVEEVAANPITGSVLVHYHPRLIGQEEIILAIQEMGYLEENPLKTSRNSGEGSSHDGTIGRVATAVASSFMEVALSSLVAAII
jgi:copper chaperone CopZ